ncbi:MAG TPA: acetyl-CoA carboxylase biotin carboxyl carrier protein subunit [Bryobacteraceae bacterium]|jgi:biotin carboxyl carrier protein|nr:acetyl-CoA carboxylase biotin carboxyl carrier protein subunit [Bryobacteraceae bacterium]
MADEDQYPAAAAGAQTAQRWARHAREDLQGSHILTEPLARWPAERVDPPPPEVPADGTGAEAAPEITIPESVLHPRPPRWLPEDAVGRSPICGQVIAILAMAGQQVNRHQPVIVIEAMKMENNIGPAVDGVLKVVHVSPGDAVKAGQMLFELV